MSTRAFRAYDRVVVVFPVNDQTVDLPACLRAVLTAALCTPISVTVVVVLDATDEDSARLAGHYGRDVHFVTIDARNSGTARAVGFGYGRSLSGDDRCWYATVDATRRVNPGWLIHQLEVGADMVLGAVHSTDRCDHIADMGCSGRAYWRVGGFRTMPSGEDVDLAERFEAAGLSIHRDTDLSVIGSARNRTRTSQGIGQYLAALGRSAAGDCA
ncbi:glycosyltransferase family 2 protein [Mycobacterium sherrisii]|uniref:Glycosyl transferase n=1 Tax=Mycobacterium sherrisii TaxID=243061 RepID=A0A1E3SXJ4_9MYCO|nr:glycosyl transferase [Mycobacterium sherrisii]MEC4763923.1 glycosyltransferase family 2 protein [Mycobacterium sherrisii]ODR06819.1 glycosyl transferase [Mycobacterium sherrisii]